MKTRRPARRTWPVGLCLALLVALAYQLGLPLLREMEARGTDWLFLNGRPSPPAASDRIVHCDIDDSAIETVGRWPWPRSVLAEAIEELDRHGARVIVLDLILTEPEPPKHEADGTLVDHDAIFSATIGRIGARTVLAAEADKESSRLGDLWQGPEGQGKWQEIRRLLRGDITLDAEELVRSARLDGPRAERVHGRLLGIKALVAREVAEELRRAGTPCTEEEMRRRLLPAAKDARLVEFPALNLIRSVIRIEEALVAVEASLPPAQRGVPYVAASGATPPLPAFARAAAAVGVVNALQDSDGQLRRLPIRWESDGLVFPQLGLAAAATFLGTAPADLAASPLQAGKMRLGTEELLLSWPRIDPHRPVHVHPHMSLGRVIDLRRQEARLRKQNEERDAYARELIARYLEDQFRPEDIDDPAKREAVEDELLDQVKTLLGPEGSDKTPEERTARGWLRYYQEAEGAAGDLARARAQIDAAVRGKLVFVGWNATGSVSDFYPTVLEERTPGVVAHAIVANSVLTGYVVRPLGAWATAIFTLVLGAAAAFLAAATGPRLSFLLALLLALLVFSAAVGLFAAGFAPPMTTPLAGVFVSWAGVVTMRAVQELREKAQLRKQFGARISPQLFKFLLDHPDQVSLEGREKEVTCFFSDLEGFTSISEKLDSKQTVALLNRYMAAMNQELTAREAYVNKFLGDGIMAVWGAFASDPRQVELACRAALACVNRLEQLKQEIATEGLPRLAMRIGIATGVATVGDCGAPPDLRDYTVIGDTANLAARLESANKQFGTRILLNGRTKELLPDDILTRPLGHVAVVGQEQATDLHELIALKGKETGAQRDLIERTERAIAAFRAGDLEGAAGAWKGIVAAHGPSPAAGLYLAEIEARLRERGPSEPVLRLSKK